MFSRAPSIALTENSASAPAIATVFGFGLSFAAVAKEPSATARERHAEADFHRLLGIGRRHRQRRRRERNRTRKPTDQLFHPNSSRPKPFPECALSAQRWRIIDAAHRRANGFFWALSSCFL